MPGGLSVYAAQRDPQILDFIRKSHETTIWTIGICNGVEILATAGILDGVEVTTNYFARDRVAKLGGKVLKTLYHRDGKIVTGADEKKKTRSGEPWRPLWCVRADIEAYLATPSIQQEASARVEVWWIATSAGLHRRTLGGQRRPGGKPRRATQ